MTKSAVKKHFDEVAPMYDFYTKKRELHYLSLKRLLKSLIPDGKRVLEIGCGTGDLIAFVKPKFGYGVDISAEMIKRARIKYSSDKNLKFSTKWPRDKFDYIFMSDVVEHLENPGGTFLKVSGLMGPKSLFINTMMNRVWIPVEAVYNFFGWKMPEGPHRRRGYKDIEMLVSKSGMKIVKHDYKLLMPIRIPFVTTFVNRYFEKYLKRLAFIEYFVTVKA